MDERAPITYDDQGLVPVVVQDWKDGTVLMLGYMNRVALGKTLETGSVHFWSRSKGRLWEKGETSGNRLSLRDVFVDCDGDTLLLKAEPTGPTCHTGERACFFTRLDHTVKPVSPTHDAQGGILEAIYRTIEDRRAAPRQGSYVSSLLQGGEDRILKKIAEEAGEVLLAAKNHVRKDVIAEVADLLFHTLVLLGHLRITIQDVYQELAGRFGQSGVRTAKPEHGERRT